jgi:hypothetical protein
MFLNTKIELSTGEPYEKLEKRIDLFCGELEQFLDQK